MNGSLARRPLICAHACRFEGGPPNTLAGLRRLLDAGVEMIEFDVRRCGDRRLVAHHDERLPDGRPVSRVSYDEIAAAYPAAARPALVADLLAEHWGATRLHLDLKEAGVESDAAATATHGRSPESLVFTTLLEAQVARLKAERPDLTVGLSLNRSLGSFAHGLSRARRAGADLLSVNHVHLRTRLPELGARAGLSLFAWTIDRDPLLERLVRDHRLAGVITNRPIRALALRDAGP